MNTTDEAAMRPEDLDTWREAAGLMAHGWRKTVRRVLGVDEKRWDRMRAGTAPIPRYLALAMAAHLAGLAPWPQTLADHVDRKATAPAADDQVGIREGRIYQRRGRKMVAVGMIGPV